MKNNPNSLINKFADIHAELIKLSKRINNLETISDKNNEEIKNENTLRQGFEKKSYQQGELLNGKIFSLRKGLEDLTSSINQQLDIFKEKQDENLKENNNKIFNSLQQKLEKVEQLDEKTKEIDKEMCSKNDENNKKITKGLEIVTENLRNLNNEVVKQGAAVEIIEKRLGEFYNNLTDEMKSLAKQISGLKNEIEVLKNFKESSLINFRDISNQFLQNDKENKEFKTKINNIVKETEAKIRMMDVNLGNQLEQIENTKKEIFAQLFDNNQAQSNKFQLVNESLIEKFEDYDKIISRFQENLLRENSKFTEYMSDQVEGHQKNNKRLFDYMTTEVLTCKEKVSNGLFNI